MKLDEKFVAEGVAKAKGCYYMGTPLTELTHDELLAVAVQGWEEYRSQFDRWREDSKRLFAR